MPKTCTKCHVEKPLDQFRQRKDRKSPEPSCLECEHGYSRCNAAKYYLENKKARLVVGKAYYVKTWAERKAYRDAHKEEIAATFKAWKSHKYATDPLFRMRHCVQTRIKDGCRRSNGNNAKSAHTRELLGCSFEELRTHLESKFKDGMNWGSYGWGNDKWNIDHVIPISLFDLGDPVEQKQCFHFTNLQPLWQPDNFRKGNRYLEV